MSRLVDIIELPFQPSTPRQRDKAEGSADSV
jgi:hypothetical protein